MKRRGNKGITLISLVITVLVLSVLLEVIVSLIKRDDGIIADSKGMRVMTKVTQFKEHVTSAEMSINTKKVTKVDSQILKQLADTVAKDLDLNSAVLGNTLTKINEEGYTVGYYLEENEGYIAIWYTDDELRSNINRETAKQQFELVDIATVTSKNKIALVSVIKVANLNIDAASLKDKDYENNNQISEYALTDMDSIDIATVVFNGE